MGCLSSVCFRCSCCKCCRRNNANPFRYLDTDDPLKEVRSSAELRRIGVQLEDVNVGLRDNAPPHQPVSNSEIEAYRQAAALSIKQNPESVKALMKQVLRQFKKRQLSESEASNVGLQNTTSRRNDFGIHSGNHEAPEEFANGLGHIFDNQNEGEAVQIINGLVYLFTCPYIYQDFNRVIEGMTEARFNNHLKITEYVKNALKKAKNAEIAHYQLDQHEKPLYRRLRGAHNINFEKNKNSYWIGFSTCTLLKNVADNESHEAGSRTAEIKFEPRLHHPYLKIPKAKPYNAQDRFEIILFPFFKFKVLELPNARGRLVIEEVKHQRPQTSRSTTRAQTIAVEGL